jgi:hypothetical protein
MKRQVGFEKLGGWTSGVVRRSRPIFRTSAYRLGRHVVQEIQTVRGEVADDEAADAQSFGQHRAHAREGDDVFKLRVTVFDPRPWQWRVWECRFV